MMIVNVIKIQDTGKGAKSVAEHLGHRTPLGILSLP
jgi:hypothetical protein